MPKPPSRRGPPAGPAVLLALAALAPAAGAGNGDASAIRYGRDIRPLLADRCFKCHGPDGAERQAELRLDERDAALAERDGRPAIAPGDASASELWRRVTSDDPDERMPPPQSHKRPLDAGELDLLRRWIESGAEYEPHWSFTAPVRPELPAVGDEAWTRGAIDRFVLARLEQEGVAPSPEADAATLLRRVFLDLTGLPPTPEELEAFLADTAPDAYERTVERLLHEEPYVTRFAERMAVPWLDAARYADTCGIHMDAGRQIWPWRDWLLAALRDGMPFDRFVTEQIAGDLLPGATDAQRVASGFNRNHVTTDEGGAIAEEYLVEYAVDRTSTTGSVFLGLTVGCARCHDHKYDPLSQRDFYGLYAYFNSIEEPGLYSQETDPKRAFEPFLILAGEENRERLDGLRTELAGAREALSKPIPGEEAASDAFLAQTHKRSGVRWAEARAVAASSSGGATLALQPDGSVLASGENPASDRHRIELETTERGLRLIALEALPDASLPQGRLGRSPNGNAVLEWIRAEAVSIKDPERRQALRLTWAWADFEQQNGDFRAVNALADDGLGWAVDAHNRPGPRAALFLADEPFGFEGGTRVEVELDYDSVYPQHVFGRVRLALGALGDKGLELLGAAASGWYATAPFPAGSGDEAFDTAFGPEALAALDLAAEFGPAKLRFNFVETFQDERLNSELGAGVNATYVARRVFAPSARTVSVALGSDDGFRLFLNGVEIANRKIERGLADDQDRAVLELPAGVSTLVLKVVNTGGKAGYSWRPLRRGDELRGALLAALLPESALWPEVREGFRKAWRKDFSSEHRALSDRADALALEIEQAEAALPRSMVMRELPQPRETFVLMRGQYDKPDRERPVQRAIPPALGRLPEGAPADRAGLAQWLTSPENPLVARVAVNRAWELAFGTGLVATSEDFGLQGEWPSHPELLDWLAVEFRESGWDVKRLFAGLVTSSTYRQSSRARPELAERDPDDRLLARYPRRRLEAEQIRDQALYVSGLLVERLGGPSVKPYQPEGLWQEIAMPQSNTRVYERGAGEDLWRRSLYTYWKRAAPPPALLSFDAPTREFCTIRRPLTSTPLQALVLWNDEQFVEAARALAQRTLTEASADDARLERMFLRCVGRKPEASEAQALAAALADFRARYAGAPEDAALLLAVGAAPRTDLDAREVAAWTMIASALFSLDAMISRG